MIGYIRFLFVYSSNKKIGMEVCDVGVCPLYLSISLFLLNSEFQSSGRISPRKKKKKARGTRHCVTHPLSTITLFGLFSLFPSPLIFLRGFKIFIFNF